jgi:CxxC motif-containing protein
MRPLVTSVRTVYGIRPRLQVCGTGDIPLARLLEAMGALDALTVEAPVVTGQVLVTDMLGLGVDVVAREELQVITNQPGLGHT